jgi:hypothetical protein
MRRMIIVEKCYFGGKNLEIA